METKIPDVEYMKRLDLGNGEPGLFVLRTDKALSSEAYENIKNTIQPLLNEFSKGSKVIILEECFLPASMPSDEEMEQLGWIKKDNG